MLAGIQKPFCFAKFNPRCAVALSALAGLLMGALSLHAETPAGKGPSSPAKAWVPSQPVNRALPKWLRFGGEFRTRVEGRTAFGFRDGSNDGYGLTRLRLNLDLTPTPWFHAFVQGQDSRVIAMDRSRLSASFKNLFDLRQAFVEFRNGEKGWLTLRAGRQELNLGAQRLVGSSDWGNTARSFDAVRLLLGREGAQLSVFAASVVVIDPAHFDKRRDGQNLHAVYGSFVKLVPRATVEPYVLWKTTTQVRSESGRQGDADIYTAGLRWVGQLPGGWDYSLEMARQLGHYSNDRVAAWAGYWIAGYAPSKLALKPRFSAEYAFATGDSGRGDGKVSTFDQLYPTNHAYYGIADQVGWRNMRNLRTGVDFKPWKSVKVNFDHHFFWLASRYDGLYNAAGALVVVSPTGGSPSKDVGREVDVFLTYTPRPAVTVGGGFGHLFPGSFLKENSPGSGTSFPYVLCTYRF